jgi:glycosyltransferase involved in cell wall biosynthesis
VRIYIAHSEDDKLGGGWSWIANAKKALAEHLSSYEEANIYLIPSPSICSKEEVDQAQADGKKIVLRIDNIVRNSRNRNSGMSRMKRFAEQSDLIIYQSEFARVLFKDFIGDGEVILNACDTDIFHDKGRQESTTAKYIYSRVNRDETKNWEMARFTYQIESANRDGDTLLHLVGQFSPELVEYNFDFYLGEDYKYWGTITDPNTMAALYRDSDYLIFTFWNDACSNTLIEALCCGCNIVDPYNMLETGGSSEIYHMFEDHGGAEYFGLKRMREEYLACLAVIETV